MHSAPLPKANKIQPNPSLQNALAGRVPCFISLKQSKFNTSLGWIRWDPLLDFITSNFTFKFRIAFAYLAGGFEEKIGTFHASKYSNCGSTTNYFSIFKSSELIVMVLTGWN